MANDLKYGSTSRESIASGVKKLADAVRVTLGPVGRNVLIEQAFGAPLIINDGITIAKNIVLPNKYENLGAQLIIEAASKTNDQAGDGTTSAVILASSLIIDGIEKMKEGANPVLLRDGFEYYSNQIIEKIKERSVPVETLDDIERIATLSSGSKQIGKIIRDAYEEVGTNGEINCEESKSLETYLSIEKGYSYDRGYASSYMINNEEKSLAELNDANVLVTDKNITSMKELLPYLENSMNTGTPLLIVCDDCSQEVLSAIVMNKMRGVFNVVLTKAPSFGDRKIEYLKDICAVTKATFVSTMTGLNLSEAGIKVLGVASKVIASQNKTILINNDEDDESLIQYIQGLKNTALNTNSLYEQEKLKERIAKLSGGVAVIKAGGTTEVDLHERKLRIEDAICAAREAIRAGVVEGAGKTLYEIAKELECASEYQEAYLVVKEALCAPIKQLIKNAGKTEDEILPYLNDDTIFDARIGRVIPKQNKLIMDPAGVEIAVVRNALGLAGIVLTTECAIVSLDEKIKESADDLL